MSSTFQLEILTPTRKLYSGTVSEVVLPAYDGEVGILDGHEDFIGLLGSGALKIVHDNDDYWYLVSVGVYQVESTVVTVLAERGEEAKHIDIEAQNARLRELEAERNDHANFDPARYAVWKRECDEVRGRIEIYRRTVVAN
jgi:F-type H+-transporting ATPase subunit epsilon